MKKASTKKPDEDLLPEYDLSELRGGVRGKYRTQAVAGTNLVLIEPELAAVFGDAGEPCATASGRYRGSGCGANPATAVSQSDAGDGRRSPAVVRTPLDLQSEIVVG